MYFHFNKAIWTKLLHNVLLSFPRGQGQCGSWPSGTRQRAYGNQKSWKWMSVWGVLMMLCDSLQMALGGYSKKKMASLVCDLYHMTIQHDIREWWADHVFIIPKGNIFQIITVQLWFLTFLLLPCSFPRKFMLFLGINVLGQNSIYLGSICTHGSMHA